MAAAKNQQSIVVTGDCVIDWLQWSVGAKDTFDEDGRRSLNWELYKGTRMTPRPGGALLLADFIREAAGAKVLAPNLQLPSDVCSNPILSSFTFLDRYSADTNNTDSRKITYRVRELRGYSGNGDGKKIPPLDLARDNVNVELVVIDDAGNGFRDHASAWPQALSGKKPLIILKHSRPLAKGKLWERLVKDHQERLVAVINADDLREEGVDLSRHLSWERTCSDLIWQMKNNLALQSLCRCRNIIVRFGLDGAILYQHGLAGSPEMARLFYDPQEIEGGFARRFQGQMTGLMTSFVAGLAASVYKNGLNGMGKGISKGLLSSRRMLERGFTSDGDGLDYPRPGLFKKSRHDARISEIVIPRSVDGGGADDDYGVFWTILSEVTANKIETAAFNYVRQGSDKALDNAPSATFGDLTTLDRSEIESYRTIRNLFIEYLEKDHFERPLSIAVFGPPGSGKSFAVTQVAKSVRPDSVQRLEFNLSQCISPNELVRLFHQVRDEVLRGKVPLVFFDEFDSGLQRDDLGWLKYFIDPMQSGTFNDGGSTHPIGKSIFVFAGATSGSLAEFSDDESEAFGKAKGPDFVSRLRGYVDIIGTDAKSGSDSLYMIRRAVLLRSMLKRKAGYLFDGADRLQIDEGVLRAFIKIPEFKHGARSIEAILDMSLLAGRKTYEPSALPPREQLELHVDSDVFTRLVVRDVLLGRAREILARAIHEEYVRNEEAAGSTPEINDSMVPWEDLPEYLRQTNREQADHMVKKLHAIGVDFQPRTGSKKTTIKFSKDEIEKMAIMEHERWAESKKQARWTEGKPGEKKNDEKRTHPCLVDWEKLPESEKRKDRQAVKKIPDLMEIAGFEIYRV